MSANKVHVQISIAGKGADRLSHDACVELVERAVDGQDIPAGLRVRIQLWRAGRELDWQSDEPRSVGLRTMIRRSLQDGRIKFSVRSH